MMGTQPDLAVNGKRRSSVLLGCSWVLLGCSWVLLGALGASSGPLGSSWGTLWVLLGCSWGALGSSWDALGVLLGPLGSLLDPLGLLLGPLGPKLRFRELLGQSGAPSGSTKLTPLRQSFNGKGRKQQEISKHKKFKTEKSKHVKHHYSLAGNGAQGRLFRKSLGAL